MTACASAPPEVRSIRATALADCPLDDVTTVELEALDDAPPRASSFVELPLRESRDAPTLPSGADAFIARARSSDGRVVALGVLARRDDRADGALFRDGRACLLRAGGGSARFPLVRGAAVAMSGDLGVIAGGGGDDEARSDLLLIDGVRGDVTRVGMRRRRAGAAAAIADQRAVIIGGSSAGELWEDAEIADLARGEILPGSIALAEKRADAAAVPIAGGAILVVGGRGPAGPLRTLEIVDPVRGVARTLDVASLTRARRSPIAARLATGEVLVLGGVDAAGAPVPDVEVLDAAATRVLRVLPLATRRAVTAAALPSGALLVVHADDAGAAAALIRADAIEALPEPPRGARPRLIAGTDGAPFLFDGSFHRFDAWSGRFLGVALPDSIAPGDAIEPLSLASGALLVAREEGESTVLRALRYDARPPLVVDPETLGLGARDHLSPDRLGVALVRDGLVLPPRARVAVTDATYGAVAIRLGATGRDRPALELRAADGSLVTRIDDDGPCSWPTGAGATTDVLRDGSGDITIVVGDQQRRCTGASASRVFVTLVAGTAEARVRGIHVTRR